MSRLKSIRTYFVFLVFPLVFAVLASCPNPINKLTLGQMTDATKPVVNVNSPEDNSQYTQTVTVQGTVHDDGAIRVLSYTVTGTLGLLSAGEVPVEQIGSDGSFQFQFSTLDFDSPIVVTITAEDWNDNVGSYSFTLGYSGSALSSLTAVPGNKTITLLWEPIPNAVNYTLYYTDNGTLPSESYGQSVAVSGSSHDLTGLKNGVLHIFLLRANMPGADDYWSNYVEVIPLSPFTLAPLVRGGYREIALEWAEIEGTNDFIVLRSLNPGGPYTNYTGTIHGNSFTDTTVSDNQWYFYKVKPVLSQTIVSTYNGAQTLLVPPPLDRIFSLTTSAAVNKVRYYEVDATHRYAYAAAGTAGVMVFDVSTPNAPSYVTTVSTTNATDLDIENNYLFVADWDGGLRAINISTPTSPGPVYTYTTNIGQAKDVSVADGRAYVLDSADTPTTIYAVDVSTPSSMNEIDSYQYTSPENYNFQDIDSGYSNPYTFIYAASPSSDAIVALWLSDASPTLHYWLQYNDETDNYNPQYVAMGDNSVCALMRKKTMIEPPPDYLLRTFDTALSYQGDSIESRGNVAQVRILDGRAFAVDKIGLRIYDISDLTSPDMIDYLNTPGTPSGVDTDGSYAFIASGVMLFQTVDLTAPTSPSIKGSYGPHSVFGVRIRDNYAYTAVAGGSKRLQVLELNNPLDPQPRGSVSMAGPGAIDLSGDYAFVADGLGGLKIVDITDPDTPDVEGSATLVSIYVNGIVVKGDYAYLSSQTGVQIFDIADPETPVWVGLHDSDGGGIKDVTIRGNIVYATDGAYFQPNSLKLIDVSNPAEPSLIGRALWSDGTEPPEAIDISSVSLYGDYAFVSDQYWSAGLYAVDINPASGKFLKGFGPCPTDIGGGNSQGVFAYGGHAYVLDGSSGFAVVNISEPTSLSADSLVHTLDLGSISVEDVIVSGKYAYITDTNEGLTIIQLF
jgi:hypothetical protein